MIIMTPKVPHILHIASDAFINIGPNIDTCLGVRSDQIQRTPSTKVKRIACATPCSAPKNTERIVTPRMLIVSTEHVRARNRRETAIPRKSEYLTCNTHHPEVITFSPSRKKEEKDSRKLSSKLLFLDVDALLQCL